MSGGQAFRWIAGTGMVGLGAGMARGVSADGSTIVGSNGLGAFRWTAGTGRYIQSGCVITRKPRCSPWTL